MISKLSYKDKNKMLLPALVVGLLLCWFLAIDKTVDAAVLHHKLKAESERANDLSFNPNYLRQKEAALDQILKGYQVKETWNEDLWIRGSAVAAKYNLGVDYTLSKPQAEHDTTAVGVLQSVSFYGDYLKLVKLVDTLEGIPGLGKIAALQIRAPKENSSGNKGLLLKIDFKGINKKLP